MFELITEVVKFLCRFVLAIMFAWTGEIVLFLITFGAHRPRWELYSRQTPARFVLFSEISLWIGAAFWTLIAFVSYRLLTNK
jgi:hypothetical protein